jgi:GT2 family glycosyltransferase
VTPPRPPVAPREVAIVVLNWRRADDSLACLESLAAAWLDGAPVLLVDNGSGDGSPERVRGRFPDVDVLELARNEGYAGGNNAGIRWALERGARAVLLLNNDARVAPDFLPPLLEVLNADPRAAAAASAVMRADSPEVLEVAYLDVYFGHGLVHRRGVNALPGEGFDKVRAVDVAVGCSLLLHADALAAVGPLDASYFAYHEEVDWCFRARRHGYRVYFQPYSRVYHGGSRSTATDATPTGRNPEGASQLPNAIPLSWNPVRTYLGARNAVRFVNKNGSLRQRLYYLASSAYAVPLELLAVAARREEQLMLGRWTYRRALALYWRGGLPRDLRRAHVEGRLEQLREHLRGLWDGFRNRPLPLERLGLR